MQAIQNTNYIILLFKPPLLIYQPSRAAFEVLISSVHFGYCVKLHCHIALSCEKTKLPISSEVLSVKFTKCLG